MILTYLNKASKWLDSHGVESRGIHRYLPEERAGSNPTRSLLSIIGLWVAGCGGLTSMSSFFLGPLLYGLGYKDTMITGLIGALIGSLFAAYCSTMGPRSGLRQMCSSRYLFGPYMIRFVSLVTVVGLVGWAITNSVLGGEIISQVSGQKVSLELGIIIVCIVSLVVALFGIKYLLRFESLVGCFVLIVALLLYIIAGPQITQYHDTNTLPGASEITKIGTRISFFNLAYSVTVTWSGNASDYYVLLPESVSQTKIFLVTFFGIAIPTVFVAVVGILIGNAATQYVPWGDAYSNYSLGGLLNTVFNRWHGFGKFLLVVFWLSLITNNTMNYYSGALDVQLMDKFFFKYLPRWFIVVVIFAITLIISLVGKNSFSAILSNFLPMIGYWISIYFTLLVEENLIFRSTRLARLYRVELYDEKSSVSTYPPPRATTKSIPYYNFDIWDNPKFYSHGYAATAAFCCGIAGAVVGMNQVYYVGPIARMVGSSYADLGTFLCMGFSGLVYPALRYLELKKFGR